MNTRRPVAKQSLQKLFQKVINAMKSTIPKSLLEFIVTFLTVFTVLMQTVRTAICLKALNHAHRGCRVSAEKHRQMSCRYRMTVHGEVR